jgi:hypothetical protein
MHAHKSFIILLVHELSSKNNSQTSKRLATNPGQKLATLLIVSIINKITMKWNNRENVIENKQTEGWKNKTFCSKSVLINIVLVCANMTITCVASLSRG